MQSQLAVAQGGPWSIKVEKRQLVWKQIRTTAMMLIGKQVKKLKKKAFFSEFLKECHGLILMVVLNTEPMWCYMIIYNFPAICLVYLVMVALWIINHYILFKENDTVVCQMMGIFTGEKDSIF